MSISNTKFAVYKLLFITFLLIITGCTNNSIDETTNTKNSLINLLSNGAVLKSEDGNYNLYNYENGVFTKVASNNIITSFNKKNSVYVEYEDNNNYIVWNNKKIKVKDDNYEGLKLSPDGKYLSYFIDDNGLKLKIYDILNNKYVQINSKTLISGTLYDWYNDDEIIYYGINSSKINGLFTYNLKDKKEKNIYEIDDGFVTFLKCTKGNIVFLKIDNENNKKFLALNKNSLAVNCTSDEIENIYDVAEDNLNFYLTGSAYGNAESLYLLNSSQLKRLVFDFPSLVICEKGLRIDNNKNILFIGCDDFCGEEKIYRYNIDGSIELIGDESVEYRFVDCN